MKTYKIMFTKRFYKKDGRKNLIDNEKSYIKEVASFNNIEKAKEYLENYNLKENETISFLDLKDIFNVKRYYKRSNENGEVILKNI